MRLSFPPGDLHLSQDDEVYVVTLKNEEIIRTRSQRRAINTFNKLRREMQEQFPDRDLTPEEKKALFEKALADYLVGDHSVRKRKRSTARSTRTFG